MMAKVEIVASNLFSAAIRSPAGAVGRGPPNVLQSTGSLWYSWRHY